MFQPFSINLKGVLTTIVKPQVMGILNITPDSFFAESRTMNVDSVKRRIEEMLENGVDIIDIGACSTRPGAVVVSAKEELNRLKIGLCAMTTLGVKVPISVDTFRADIAEKVVNDFGVDIINDISGGDMDDNIFDVIAKLNVPYILTHTSGTPEMMQKLTDYDDVTADVLLSLSMKLRHLRLLGVSDVIIDPGFGFGKTMEQNYTMLKSLEVFPKQLNAPLLVGFSRKSMIKMPLNIESDSALNGTTVLNTIALMRGASIIRVHDVKAAKEAVKLWELSNSI
ncbi:MAG: dihydropteroate synthase [Muribaculum sp.]|nr:dihydropteroate synthase [Muribaculum sp.]